MGTDREAIADPRSAPAQGASVQRALPVSENPSPYQTLDPLSADDFAALRQSIVDRPDFVEIHVDEEGTIIDGHHRAQICEAENIPFARRVHHGLSDWEKRTLSRELNVARRHLTTKQKQSLIEDQLRDTPSLSDRAIAARLAVSDKTVGTRRRALEKSAEIPHLEERTDQLGRSRPARKQTVELVDDTPAGRANTVKQAKRIRGENQKESHALRMAKHAGIKSAGIKAGSLEALKASGPFQIVYADPCWGQDAWSDVTGQEKGAVNHYPTASVEEICSHAPPVADDALLFLWATANNLVLRALPVMSAWGFEYVTQFAWGKVNRGTGRWVIDYHEILIIAKRGNFPGPPPGTQPGSLYSEVKGKHSQKPDYFRQQIVDCYSPGLDASQRLEMYAREKSPDFEVWGLEA